MKRMFYCLLSLAALLGSGCHQGTNAPDVSGIPVTLTVKRFDQDLFALDSNRLPEEWPALGAKYPSLAPSF